MNKLLLMLMVVWVSVCLAGCNTIVGIGKDIEELGRAMQGEPDDDF